MDFKEEKMKEFDEEFPHLNKIHADVYKTFLCKVLEEQKRIHEISNECMKVCYEENEKRLRLSEEEVRKAIEIGEDNYLKWYKEWWNLRRPNQLETERLQKKMKNKDEFIAKAIIALQPKE